MKDFNEFEEFKDEITETRKLNKAIFDLQIEKVIESLNNIDFDSLDNSQKIDAFQKLVDAENVFAWFDKDYVISENDLKK